MPSHPSQIPTPSSRRPSPQPDASRKSTVARSTSKETILPTSRPSPNRLPKVTSQALVGLKAQDMSSSVDVLEGPKRPGCQNREQLSEIAISQIQSRFVGAHLGSPCTLGALDHRLQCGHKAMTPRPERCGPNCQTHSSALAKVRSAKKPYLCMACIVVEVKRAHDAKAISFQEELKAIAKASGKSLPREEIARRLEVMEIGWRELDLKEIRGRMKHGRLSHPFYVEPGYANAVEAIIQERYPREPVETKSAFLEVKSVDKSDRAYKNSEHTCMATASESRSSSRSSSKSANSSESTKSRLPVRRK